MKIIVTGSSGFIGSALVDSLQRGHHEVRRVRHSEPLAPAAFEATDAVIHLAGENIGASRWTVARKKQLYESRVQYTREIAAVLTSLTQPPGIWLSASAVGFYGHRGEAVLTETSEPGTGFLAETCRDWEGATQPAAAAGIRVAQLRFGVVVDPKGGAVAKMLIPFRLGAGGMMGDGRQWMSWISRADAVRAIEFILQNAAMHGPVNFVSPNPVTNREFTKTLGRLLHRPTVMTMPGFVARAVFGEMATEVLLASTRVEPRRLVEAGFVFAQPTLESALGGL